MGLRRLDNPIPSSAGAALAGLLLVLAALPAGAQGDTEAERDAVRDQQARLAEQLDVLKATDAEIDAALDELDDAVASQRSALQAAMAAADQAAAEARRAERDLAAAREDVEALERAIAEMAVASYIHPPTSDLIQSLQAPTLSDALKQQVFLAARAQRDLSLLDLLEDAEARAELRAQELAAATEAAQAAVAAADAEVARLDAERARQAQFASELQGRIDGALAEAAALADLDAELSAQIVAEQAALIERLPPVPPPTATPVTTPVTTPIEVEDEPAPAAPSAPEPVTTTTRPPTSTSTTPARPRTPAPPLATVAGFTVHAEIAEDLEAMLDAAAADGITFGGSGYRSTERQIQLRIANCGPTEYDIWYRPASTCSPPTAIPGRSLHEQGRALDLTYEGRLITTRANEGFQWLADNAASYGFFNLPSEPWHWSTTGA